MITGNDKIAEQIDVLDLDSGTVLSDKNSISWADFDNGEMGFLVFKQDGTILNDQYGNNVNVLMRGNIVPVYKGE